MIKDLVADLVKGDYQKVYKNDYKRLLTTEEIKEAIEDYPGIISVFPESAFNLMRLYRNTDTNCDIDFPLWYDSGRSDLTMVCNLKLLNGKYRYSIEGILVQ